MQLQLLHHDDGPPHIKQYQGGAGLLSSGGDWQQTAHPVCVGIDGIRENALMLE
jgi:hypothetical protein